MKNLKLLALYAMAAVTSFSALTKDDLNEGFWLQVDSFTGAYSFSWTARLGRTYFVEYSTDLMTWKYFPLIEQGNGIKIEYGFLFSGGNRFFTRLRVTDTPTTNPMTADFDGDGISNYDELLLGTDPVNFNTPLVPGGDADGDGIVNEQDAAPSDATVGRLSMTISYPANNSTIN
jgi:hypothetical protein